MRLEFTIPGEPCAKSRTRFAHLFRCRDCQRRTNNNKIKCKGCGSDNFDFLTAIPYTPTQTNMYQNQVTQAARDAMMKANITELFYGPIGIILKFHHGIPVSRRKKLKDGDLHSQKPDLDNNIKSVLDGLGKHQRAALANDCQISWLLATKLWTNLPRTEIVIMSDNEIWEDE